MHQTSGSWDIITVYILFCLKSYIFSTKGVNQSTNLVKFYVSSQKSEILLFDGLLWSKSCIVSAKKSIEELSFITLKSDANFKEKLTCSIKHGIRNLLIFTQPLKCLKISFRWVIFVQSMKVWYKKNTKELYFMTLNSDANLNKPWPCGFKTNMRNWVNFH